MIRKIAKFIEEQQLMPQAARVVVAISGGADSVALLLILRKLGYSCHAAHCNFHLRGEESMRDEKFVRELCNKLGTPLHVADFATAEHAKQNGISIEMAARELRYKFFDEIKKKTDSRFIAVAHHCDDNAETVLLNLIRGTGIRGLHGIRPKNGDIVRPLLCISRKDIMLFLDKEEAGYVTDSTNLTSDFTRNKIRLEIIPLMKQINPSIVESLSATAEKIAQAEMIYNKGVAEGIARVKNGNSINIKQLKNETAAKTILHEILSPLGFNGSQVADICNSMDSESGRRFKSNEWEVVKDREEFIIQPNKNNDKETACTLPDEGTLLLPDGSLTLTKEIFNGRISKQPDIATLDAGTLKQPLSIRRTRPGDRFIPFGMRGSKLVSDYLTDRKANIIKKERQRVITDADGNIVWLVGERPAAPFCVSKSTKEILRMEWHDAKLKEL